MSEPQRGASVIAFGKPRDHHDDCGLTTLFLDTDLLVSLPSHDSIVIAMNFITNEYMDKKHNIVILDTDPNGYDRSSYLIKLIVAAAKYSSSSSEPHAFTDQAIELEK